MRAFIAIIFILFIFLAVSINALNEKQSIIKKLRKENKEILFQKDSISIYYSDIANCIREHLGIDTTTKTQYKQIKIK